MGVSDYNTTPISNSSINGINIAEGWSAADMNNALRQMMADIAEWYDERLVVGTDVQAYSALLTEIDGDVVSVGSSRILYKDATGTWTGAEINNSGLLVLSSADFPEMRTRMGLGSAALQGFSDDTSLAGAAANEAVSERAAKLYTDGLFQRSGSPHVVVEDVKASGVDGQTISASTWTKRDLNTIVRDSQSLLTLSNSQFFFANDGWLEWSCPGRDNFSTRLYSTTTSSVVKYGQTMFGSGGSIVNSTGCAFVTAGTTYRIEQRSTNSQPGGYGVAFAPSSFTRMKYWRR